MNGTRILVTGGTGFIGTHLVNRLVNDGNEVTVLDLFPPQSPAQSVRYLAGDIRDLRAVTSALEGCEEVFHLAAAHHDSGISEATFQSVNVDGTRLLLDACERHFIKRFCFFSSVAVYGSSTEVRDENSPLAADNPYGRSKLLAERLVQDATEASRVPCLIVRPTVTFGEGNFANMYSLMSQIYRRRFLHVGTGENIKSMGYVHNLIDMTMFLWRRLNHATTIANWSEPEQLSSRQIVEALSHRLQRPIPTVSIPLSMALWGASFFELSSKLGLLRTDVSRARVRKLVEEQTAFAASTAAAADFRRAYTFDEALDRTVAWFIESGRSLSPSRRIPPAVARSTPGTF